MSYLLLFLEGLLTFISPCLLPMLPIYIGYFAGQVGEEIEPTQHRRKILTQALLFVAGFSLVFIVLSLFVSTLGRLFVVYKTHIHLIVGLWMIFLGIDYMLHNRFMNAIMQKLSRRTQAYQTGNSFILGWVFAISWTPCVGTFLASALAYAATANNSWESVLLLASYCLGLGLPFILTALLLDEFQASFNWIKAHSRHIQLLGGLLLILMGLSMMTGWLDHVLNLLS